MHQQRKQLLRTSTLPCLKTLSKAMNNSLNTHTHKYYNDLLTNSSKCRRAYKQQLKHTSTCLRTTQTTTNKCIKVHTTRHTNCHNCISTRSDNNKQLPKTQQATHEQATQQLPKIHQHAYTIVPINRNASIRINRRQTIRQQITTNESQANWHA